MKSKAAARVVVAVALMAVIVLALFFIMTGNFNIFTQIAFLRPFFLAALCRRRQLCRPIPPRTRAPCSRHMGYAPMGGVFCVKFS